MNTVKIGDKFEDKSYDLIEKAINNNELGISKSSTKVFRKKGYYSNDREKEIIFDLAIEVWPEGAERYTLLYLVECKSSVKGHSVPVDDVEEFFTKYNQVSGGGVKGVMITDNHFQYGGSTFAKNKRIMLIEVDKENNHKIILHKTEREITENKQIDLDNIFFNFIKKTLGVQKVSGLKKLNAEQIEELVLPILRKYNQSHLTINVDEFLEHLKLEYNLQFDFTKNLETVNGKKITGYFDIENNSILIDKSIVSTGKFLFVLGHELGHFFLHNDLTVNQERYNDFEDSEYDFFTDRFNLINDKNWIEWQANKFSIALFLPKFELIAQLIAFRQSIGISRPEHIYLDEQFINKQDYYKTLDYLTTYFGISKTSIIFRLEELKLITYIKPKGDLRNIMRRAFYE